MASATALVCTSHSPLMDFSEPAAGVRADVEAAMDQARRFIVAFEPDLVILFAPDHYNGIFYDMMPPFCIGSSAESIGDYDTPAGALSVDAAAAEGLVRAVLAQDIDVTLSMRMYVDHGFAQPLQLLFGGLDRVATVPVFINGLAAPFGPVRRARALGNAIGRAAEILDRRILFLGSGGLSHDPPAPRIESAPPEVLARIVSEGRRLTPQQRAERERRTIQAGRDCAAGTSEIQPLNPNWDRHILDTLAAGRLADVEGWSNEWFLEQGGHSAHEVRTWIAAYAALAVAGRYRVTTSFYHPIPEWIAGFAITCALTESSIETEGACQ
jgi:2,3-dihydroxyphenylpropionate 1,2-dioxygenase